MNPLPLLRIYRLTVASSQKLRFLPSIYCRRIHIAETPGPGSQLSSSASTLTNRPKDPQSSSSHTGPTYSSPETPAPSAGPTSSTYQGPSALDKSSPPDISNVPAVASSRIPVYSRPPFDTHAFYTALEKTFPTPTARSLMRATCALLVDRIGKVRQEGLTTKDLENQAYLFRAALSELRGEISLIAKNDTAAIRSATAALRREVDRLDVKMKEDIATLKHEIQMDLESRKNEAKSDLKQQDIKIEELLNKAVVNISELRTFVEEIKWNIMLKAVGGLAFFVFFIIVMNEFSHKPKAKSAPAPTRLPSEDNLTTETKSDMGELPS